MLFLKFFYLWLNLKNFLTSFNTIIALFYFRYITYVIDTVVEWPLNVLQEQGFSKEHSNVLRGLRLGREKLLQVTVSPPSLRAGGRTSPVGVP